jgi:hypothetical protein
VSSWTDAASFATAGGTLVLAIATFASVRVSNRAARTTERSLLAGMLPLLVPSRVHDPPEKIRFIDDHWIEVSGGHAAAEATDDVIYLAIPVRNVGQGLALLDRWSIDVSGTLDADPERPETFRRLTRDLYVAAGDVGYWQGAFRDASDPIFSAVATSILERRILTIDLLYGDFEGGQRTITRFHLTPRGDTQWMSTVSRHWRLDRPNPRVG